MKSVVQTPRAEVVQWALAFAFYDVEQMSPVRSPPDAFQRGRNGKGRVCILLWRRINESQVAEIRPEPTLVTGSQVASLTRKTF